MKSRYELFHLVTENSLFHIVFLQHSTDDVGNFVAFLMSPESENAVKSVTGVQ